jgi:hypothetical protein
MVAKHVFLQVQVEYILLPAILKPVSQGAEIVI